MYEADFSEFGYREISMANELLNAYLESRDIGHISGLKVGFNPNSGYVFLVNDEYDVYMMNGDKLRQFHSCPECGNEGFREEFKEWIGDCENCKNLYNDGHEEF